MMRSLLSILLAVFISLPIHAQETRREAAQLPLAISYESFTALDAASRQARWSTLDGDTREVLVRTHAERWLATTGSNLTRSQLQAIREFIEFLPGLFHQHATATPARELQLRASVRCKVGRQAFDEAFAILQPPAAKRPRTLRTFANDWADWFVECVEGPG